MMGKRLQGHGTKSLYWSKTSTTAWNPDNSETPVKNNYNAQNVPGYVKYMVCCFASPTLVFHFFHPLV